LFVIQKSIDPTTFKKNAFLPYHEKKQTLGNFELLQLKLMHGYAFKYRCNHQHCNDQGLSHGYEHRANMTPSCVHVFCSSFMIPYMKSRLKYRAIAQGRISAQTLLPNKQLSSIRPPSCWQV